FLVFGGVAEIVGNRFAGDAALAAGADLAPRKTRWRGASARAVWGRPLWAERAEGAAPVERRSLPLAQDLVRVLYLLPLTFILLRNAEQDLAAAVALGSGVMTLIAGQLAASFAWTTISGEDAPDLIACAPVDAAFARRAKLTAAVIPVAGLLVL